MDEYIAKNMESEIVRWMQTDFTEGGGRVVYGDSIFYLSPAKHLNDVYYSLLGDNLPPETTLPPGFSDVYVTNSYGNNSALRALGGIDTPTQYLFIRVILKRKMR